jgi:erythromycin esterase-like protein
MRTATASTIDLIRDKACRLTGAADELDPLMDLIGDARIVLLGEATHGTHEFYLQRAEVTRLLIQEKGFNAVAVEADFPDAYRVNRFVRVTGKDRSAEEALSDFKRFPLWMWRNTEVLAFVRWLRQHNEPLSTRDRCGFYGVDLYSLGSSIEAVIRYLQKVDPEAAKRARDRYACFGNHHGLNIDPQHYGYAATLGLTKSCEDEVVAQLTELQRKAREYLSRDDFIAADEQFFAEQNAALAKNAEKYYRTMFAGAVSSWNVRDQHMAGTIDALIRHLDRVAPPAKIVVWEHNSHLGDARATAMGEEGELNVGQLVRQKYGRDAVLIGFTTYTGEVSAADDWGEPVQRKRVRPALAGSYEELLHNSGLRQFYLTMRDDRDLAAALREPLLERAIGVIYRPRTERASHYFRARLSDQFDAVIHFDTSRALEPMDMTAGWETGEPPETYPTGL